jgi:AraC-like DNA-binding protein
MQAAQTASAESPQTGSASQKTLRSSYASDLETLSHSMLGLSSLFDEMAAQGVSRETLLVGTGVQPAALDDPQARMSHQQKLVLFRNVLRLSREPGVGLRVGQRQRLSDFGVYGYALSSSATLGEAIAFGIRHVKLAGPVLEKSFRVESGVAIFEGHDVIALGELLPLVSEYWFSSIHTLIGRVMEHPFRAYQLMLPYPAPAHAALYPQVFGCPVEFNAGVMQWHFDPALLDEPCPNANPITADMCTKFCARMLQSLGAEEPELVRTIRLACLNSVGGLPGVEQMAARLHVSPRTLHRRLVEAGTGYQEILDDVRRRLAEEFLRNTALSIDEIAARTGFSDASNFRKAFRKWTGEPPADYRLRTSPWKE